ncbi:MAG: hypothetical protein IPP36_06865 [Nitrosomonadales bacterium]|nr:hypothetical protein [Nitrosomonadales bacterium]
MTPFWLLPESTTISPGAAGVAEATNCAVLGTPAVEASTTLLPTPAWDPSVKKTDTRPCASVLAARALRPDPLAPVRLTLPS